MIVDLPVLDAADLPLVEWRRGDAAPTGAARGDLARVRCTVDVLGNLADTLRPDGPMVRLEVAPGPWPDLVDVGALVARGVTGCSFDTRGLTGAGDWVRFVGFLVGAREHGLQPQWSLPRARPDWVCSELLNHLTPPIDTADAGSVEDVAEWTAKHRFGSLYWRRGPGFVSVVDARGEDTARYLIDDADLLALFGALAAPVRLETVSVAIRHGFDDLEQAGLVVLDDGVAVRLPYRLTHRPMPGNRV